MTLRERLTRAQIILLRSLALRGGAVRAVTIAAWQCVPALPLWRRGLIEIWYRQSPSGDRSWQGPFYSLTTGGFQLASNFIPRLGASGAEAER